jgi:hypothetical protein
MASPSFDKTQKSTQRWKQSLFCLSLATNPSAKNAANPSWLLGCLAPDDERTMREMRDLKLTFVKSS